MQPRRAAARLALPLPAAISSSAFIPAKVAGLGQRFTDDLQCGANHGIVSARPGGLLLGLDGVKVDSVLHVKSPKVG